MSEYRIVFSPRARDRLKEMADYLHQQQLSDAFIVEYLKSIENWLETVLLLFPDCGTPMPKFGEGIRRVVYQKYSFIYRHSKRQIEILTIYRENLA